MPGAAEVIAARSCRSIFRAFGGAAARYSETVVAVAMAHSSQKDTIAIIASEPSSRVSVVFFPMRTVLFAVLFSSLAVAQEPPAIRGFTAPSTAAERAAEQKFQSIPQPDNLREYMRAITAEPHHAGSPNSKKVADYVLDK